jgi:hypothetical protein
MFKVCQAFCSADNLSVNWSETFVNPAVTSLDAYSLDRVVSGLLRENI